MNKSIRNLIIGSALLGIGAAIFQRNKNINNKKPIDKNDVEKNVTNFTVERKYHKVADIYKDENNEIQLKKVM